MIDLNEVNKEIEKLEHSDTTYPVCTKLAVLYAIRNNTEERTIPPVSYRGNQNGETAFLQAVSMADYNHVLSVMDEHMELIRLLYPKEYTAIINKIENG